MSNDHVHPTFKGALDVASGEAVPSNQEVSLSDRLRRAAITRRPVDPVIDVLIEAADEIERLRAVFERIIEEYKSYEGWDWYGYIRNALSGNAPWGAEWQAHRKAMAGSSDSGQGEQSPARRPEPACTCEIFADGFRGFRPGCPVHDKAAPADETTAEPR